MDEIEVTIKVKIDPDLTSHVGRTGKQHTDPFTGQVIPRGSEAVIISARMDGGRKIYPFWLTTESYKENILPKLK